MSDKVLVTRSSMPPMEEYIDMIKPLWDSHWLTNMGMYHKGLEKKLCEFCDVEYSSLMVNGHMALELAIQSMNFPKGSEVITTPFTFISTTHAIIRNGLVPVFCDIQEDYTIDVSKIEELITEKTVAIVPVHVYGNICDVEAIEKIAYKYDLKVIYDAAHAFGEKYKGRNIATYGDVSVFSFHATKVFNTIEGGMVCCHTKEQYDKLYNLKNFGIRSEELVVSVGANAKMNEFQAAMGICNLRHLDGEIEKRKNVVNIYRQMLSEIRGIKLNSMTPETEYNYAYMPILCENNEVRDRLYIGLKEHNIFPRKYFYPITADSACFKNKYKNVELVNARDVSERILVLPLFADLEKEIVEYICDSIKEILGG